LAGHLTFHVGRFDHSAAGLCCRDPALHGQSSGSGSAVCDRYPPRLGPRRSSTKSTPTVETARFSKKAVQRIRRLLTGGVIFCKPCKLVTWPTPNFLVT
jgi:hypothetical protein